MFSRKIRTLLGEHSGKEGDRSHPLTFLRRLQLELKLWQNGQKNSWRDQVQLVDQVVHFATDCQLGVALAQNQGLIEELETNEKDSLQIFAKAIITSLAPRSA